MCAPRAHDLARDTLWKRGANPAGAPRAFFVALPRRRPHEVALPAGTRK